MSAPPRSIRTAVLLVLALALAACSGGGLRPNARNTGPAGPPTRGGSLSTYTNQQFFSFDPKDVQVPIFGAQGGYMAAIYGLLFYVDHKTDKVRPDLGESLTSEPGCRTWNLKLRDGVRFSDGTPLDAQAVKTNYERIQDPAGHSPLAVHLAGVKMKTAGDRTLRLTLPAPNCQFDVVAANNLSFVASPTAIKKQGKQFYANPVGAGPFRLQTWNRSAGSATVVRNPSYFRSGQPYLDKITFTYATNATTALNTLLRGQVQLSGALFDTTTYDKAVAQGLATRTIPANGGAAIQFNTLRKPFDKLCARQVVAYGLDPAAMSRALNKSKLLGGPTHTLFQPGSPFYDPRLRFPSNDRAKATAYAKQCQSQGDPVRFTILANAGVDQQAAEYVASRLNTIPGVHAAIRVISVAQAATVVFLHRDFQLVFYPGAMMFGDPVPQLSSWLMTKGAVNITGYSNKQMDAALAEGQSAHDVAARRTAYEQVQRLWIRDLPFWMYAKAQYYFVFAKNVAGVDPVNPGNELLRWNLVGYAGKAG